MLALLQLVTVARLKRIVALEVPSEIASLHFSTLDNPTQQFPLIATALDRAGAVWSGDTSDYVQRICDELRTLPPLLTEQEEERFIVWENIDDRGPVHALEQPMDGWEEAIFIPWFADCWKRAGGAQFARHATVEAWSWDARTVLR